VGPRPKWVGTNDAFGRHCGQYLVGCGIRILTVQKMGCAHMAFHAVCVMSLLLFGHVLRVKNNKDTVGSQVVHIFILYYIRIASWCRIRRIFLVKKPLFGDKVLENQQLANVHNMGDDEIARLKTEIELLMRKQNDSRLS
jgi:hypothetical protein